MELSKHNKRRREEFKKIKKYQCSECGLADSWNNKPLTLHIDHIDGKRFNNQEENLRWLCPNCHSQTETYCSKNLHRNNTLEFKKYIKNHIENDTINDELKKYSNYDLGKKFNLSAPMITSVFKSFNIIKTRVCHDIIRKTERPSKEKLIELVTNQPMTQVGKMFGVSDNAVRKWCKSYKIDNKIYWGKQKDKIGKSAPVAERTKGPDF